MRRTAESSRAALIWLVLAAVFSACQSKIVHEIIEYATTGAR